MKQFYEIYHKNEKLSALLRELTWTNNLLILSSSKSEEEREFYILTSIKSKYSSRELERQIQSGMFERTMLANEKLSPTIKDFQQALISSLKKSY